MIDLTKINWKILKVTSWSDNTIWDLPIDWLYNLSNFYKEEELDYVYSNSFNRTKFYKILLKEWWFYLKQWWKIILDFQQNKILSFSEFIGVLNLFFQKNYSLEYFDLWNENIRIEITKNISTRNENDLIENWTFWIITNWERIEWIEKVIQSILKQEIPNFEIIICWKLIDKSIIEKYNLKYVEFTEKDEIWWITRKKNLVVQNAKYENLMIMHDKIILDDNWYNWMQKYWNNFESLSCITKNIEGKRYSDWKVVLWKDLYFIKNKIYSKIRKNVDKWVYKESLWFDQYYLNYNDWDVHSSIVGHFNILKKRIASKVQWDENLYWNCAEDVALSSDIHANGFLNKFNPYSEVTSLNFRQAEHPIISFDVEKLWKLKWQYILRGIFLIVKILKKTWIYSLLEPLVNKLKKTNVYQKITK